MNQTTGPLLVYPMIRKNEMIGPSIKIKGYLSRYRTMEDWMNLFNQKWKTFEDRKAQFDLKMILSPGQQIFCFI
ncbi:hypothetical protein VitviT2T_010039 [Vitis vinifera]|uniref:Cytokinin dehydrogenase 1 FAD/cytokinin binding domain-containing protein n=1 Tax=Vitis vinifera TaxID=29760 RepID=A0ABY9C863_VITVI|nr:hypothetical protein VitviT2T_010039 [Vitis vinifera]